MESAALLRSIPLFESLTTEDIASLASRLEERHVAAGTVIFSHGDPGATLFIIRDGAVEVSVGQGKSKIVLASLFEGQYFGELSLLDGQPRSATVTTIRACDLLALDRDEFTEFLKKKPEAGIKIIGEMCERIRHTNELMSRVVSRNVMEEVEDKLTFGQRIADKVAKFGGSWGFIGTFSLVMALWMGLNAIEKVSWDPMPFILLNLILSTIAALQAPVIMMSQNRQATKDKALAVNDFQVNLKNELGIEKIMTGQSELLQRVMLMERHLTGRPAAPSSTGQQHGA